jgi:hypothetical protein
MRINLECILVCAQGTVGILIVIGGVLLIAMGTDKESRLIHKLLLVGLVVWGAWFAWLALHGQHDSPAALALALCVAVVVLVNGRQIRGILDGEPWWPKHSPNPRKIGRQS